MDVSLKTTISQLPMKKISIGAADGVGILSSDLRPLSEPACWVLIQPGSLIDARFADLKPRGATIIYDVFHEKIDDLISAGKLSIDFASECCEAYDAYGRSESVAKKIGAESIHISHEGEDGAVIIDSRLLEAIGIDTTLIASEQEKPRPLIDKHASLVTDAQKVCVRSVG